MTSGAVKHPKNPCETGSPKKFWPRTSKIIPSFALCGLYSLWAFTSLLCSYNPLLSCILFSKEHSEKVRRWHLLHYVFYRCSYHYWSFLGLKVELNQPKISKCFSTHFCWFFSLFKRQMTVGWFHVFVWCIENDSHM